MADSAASVPAPESTADQGAYLDALVQKHAKQIYEEIKQNKTIEQQKQLWRDNGIDPEKLLGNYPELIEKSELLRKDNIAKTRKAQNIGQITSLGTLATLLVLPTKRIYNNSLFVKGVFTALGSAAAGVLSYLGATRVLTRNNRAESAKISVQSRDVLIYNLALLYEMKERRTLAGQPDPVTVKNPEDMADRAHKEPAAMDVGAMAAKQSLAAAKASIKSRKPSYAEQLKAEAAAETVINKSMS